MLLARTIAQIGALVRVQSIWGTPGPTACGVAMYGRRSLVITHRWRVSAENVQRGARLEQFWYELEDNN